MVQQSAVVCPEIIGREREMASLRHAFNEVGSGHGQIIIISGEAGIGKSRLVDEFKQTLLNTDVTVFQGISFEQDQTFPFSLWIEGIRSILTNLTDKSPEADSFTNRGVITTRESFRQLIAPFARDFIKLFPEIENFLPEVVPSPALDSEAEKHRLFETWAKFFTRLSQGSPLLMILEDLHWSDDVSLDLLQFLTRRILSQPIERMKPLPVLTTFWHILIGNTWPKKSIWSA